MRGAGRGPLMTLAWAIALVLVGALLRLGLFERVSRNPALLVQGDGGGYEQIARNIMEGHGFSRDAAPPYRPDMLRTPGYPLFIIGIYAVAGYRPEIVVLAQNLLSLITLCIGYRLALRLFGAWAAWAAAALMALDMGAIILANVTLTETPFMLLFVAGSYCLVTGMAARRGWRWMAGAGLLLGLAALVRPALIYLPLLLMPFLLWAARGRRREQIARCAALGLAFAVTLAPWAYRNLREFGSPNFTLAARSMTLAYHAQYLRAGRNHTTLAEEGRRFQEEVTQELGGRTASEVELNRLQEAKARAEITQHPAEYAALYAKSIGLMLVLPNTNFLANSLGILQQSTGIIADMRTRTWAENARALAAFAGHYLAGSPDQALFLVALVAEVAGTFLTYVLALVGIVAGLKDPKRSTVLLLLVIVAYFLLVTGPIGTGRYRLPAMPYLMMLAGSGLVFLWAQRQARIGR